MMIEQPLGWDDLYSHVELQKKLDTPICLDECIHTEGQARAAIELGACKIINIKLGRVGGHTVARRIHDLCERHGVPVWCGGMLESGIRRAHNIALSTLPNFTFPGAVAASKRSLAEDIIHPRSTVSPQGTTPVPARPRHGFGAEVTPQAVKVLKAVAARTGRPLEFVELDWSADKYLREGVSLPGGAVEMLRDEFDAILFGALGDPRVPSNQHAADILLGLRFKLDLYVNARPVELLHERLTPLRDRKEQDVRIMVVRENTEGLYVGIGGVS